MGEVHRAFDVQREAALGGPLADSSSVTRLPITRSATVISARDRIPTGPATGNSRGRVSSPASRRAIEKASP